MDKPLIECDKKLKRVLVLHSTHLLENGIRSSYKLALNNYNIIDRYVVLTDYQKKDIQKDFDIEDEKIKVIPHFVEKMKSHEINEKNNQFCYVGRISKEKQIDHIIKAFSIYISKGNDSKLLIYGKDEDGELNSLKILVKELNLNEYVEFKGYTSNPEKVFENS
ncbi:glycosyltransferase, partial [Mammaliicoccus fleurettii]|nr:glycosyltransferase [Mammaliicoccus fleurettii]